MSETGVKYVKIMSQKHFLKNRIIKWIMYDGNINRLNKQLIQNFIHTFNLPITNENLEEIFNKCNQSSTLSDEDIMYLINDFHEYTKINISILETKIFSKDSTDTRNMYHITHIQLFQQPNINPFTKFKNNTKNTYTYNFANQFISWIMNDNNFFTSGEVISCSPKENINWGLLAHITQYYKTNYGWYPYRIEEYTQ